MSDFVSAGAPSSFRPVQAERSATSTATPPRTPGKRGPKPRPPHLNRQARLTFSAYVEDEQAIETLRQAGYGKGYGEIVRYALREQAARVAAASKTGELPL